MMKPVLVTIFLVLASTSLALKTSSSSGTSFQSLHIDKISTLGSALKSLIQLADGDDFDKVLEILDEVNGDFNIMLTSTQNSLENENEQFEESSKKMQENIDFLTEQLDQTNQDLDRERNNRDQLKEAISQNNGAIRDAQDQINQEETRRAEVAADHKAQIKAIDQSLSAISEALDIIEKVRTANSQIVGLSFLQTQRKKLSKQLGVIHQKLSLTSLKTSPMSFYVNQLIQVAEQATADDADAGAIVQLMTQITALLNDFKTNLSANRSAIEAAELEDQRRSKEALDGYAAIIAAQQEALGQNQKNLAKTVEKIENLEAQVESYTTAKEKAEENFARATEVHEEKVEKLEQYIEKLEKDLDVIQRAIGYVRQQSVAAREDNESS